MSRRAITAILAAVFALLLLAVTPADAQNSPNPTPPSTTPSTGPPFTPPGPPPTTGPPQVNPDVEERPSTTVRRVSPNAPTTTIEVQTEVVSRPLPRTGGDINGTVIAGLGLTAFGIVLAVGARRRRNRFDTVS